MNEKRRRPPGQVADTDRPAARKGEFVVATLTWLVYRRSESARRQERCGGVPATRWLVYLADGFCSAVMYLAAGFLGHMVYLATGFRGELVYLATGFLVAREWILG